MYNCSIAQLTPPCCDFLHRLGACISPDVGRTFEARREGKGTDVKTEEADARKGRQVAKHCVFPMICGSGGSKSRLAKVAGAEPAAHRGDEKLAGRTFRSQNVQNTIRVLLEVRMSKKVHAIVARSTFRSHMSGKKRFSDHFWRFRCRFASLQYTTLRYTTLHYIKLYSTALHSTTLHYTTPHNTTTTTTQRHNYTPLNYTTLHYTTLHSTTLYCTTLHYLPLYFSILHYTTTTNIKIYSTTRKHTILHYITLYYTTLHYTTPPSTTLHYTTLH